MVARTELSSSRSHQNRGASFTRGEPPAPRVQANDFRIGDWLVQHSRHRLEQDDDYVHLEPKLADLLLFLARQNGAVASKEEILDAVWGTRIVSESALTRTMAQLRSALRDDAHAPVYIETIPKRGYRLAATVEWNPSPPLSLVQTARLRARRIIDVFVGIALSARPRRNRMPVARPSFAVLPFVDLTTAADDRFADSLTEALLTRLAARRALRLASQHSSELLRTSHGALPKVAADLGVDALVRGSVLRCAGRVRISVQVVDVRSDTHLWAEDYERELADVLELQREVAEVIAAEIAALCQVAARPTTV